MRYEIKFLLIYFISFLIYTDSFKYNNPNNHGVVGLINIPTARFYEESSTTLTAYKGDPDRKLSLTLMPYDWFEASIFYSSIDGKKYPNYEWQDYVDKGFNAKFRIKQEGLFPAIAIGFNDIAGTGIYSSEYIVGSYGVENLDLHLGVGWGVLSGGKYTYDNILGNIDSSFYNRDSETGRGGQLSLDNYFSGKKMGLFGGVSYLLNQDWLLKFEIDSTDIPLEKGFPIRNSNYSIAAEYIALDNLVFSFNYERNDFLGIKAIWKNNSSSFISNPYKSNEILEKNKIQKLKKRLAINNIGVKSIKQRDDSLYLSVTEYAYSDYKNLETNINKALIENRFNVEETIISFSTAGLDAYKTKNIEGKNLDAYKTIYERKENSLFTYSPNIVLRPFIAGRENFLKLALLGELNTEFIIRNNLFWSTNFKVALWQDFDDLYIPPVNTYPNQVRSDIKMYLKNFKNGVILGRSQFDFFQSINDSHHFQFTVGILEEMFSGYGMEYLWKSDNLPFALGFESFQIYKRDYDLGFGLLDYKNITSHINFYYENEYILPFSAHISFGEYLAGDIGYTFDISRRFNNGVVMGGFFTRTDVSKKDFGEGSFDKGIYFKIPIKDEWFNFSWRPLTKDPGAKLIRKNTLYDLLRKYR